MQGIGTDHQRPGRPRETLTAFTPLPPERNGIADYAALLLGALADDYDCAAACEDPLAEAPPGVAVLDPALAHRRVGPGGQVPGGRVLHQLGNNPGHGFVLRALRTHPGVTTLHDPGLLHLHEATAEPLPTILAGMRDAPPPLAAIYGRHLRHAGVQTRANHLLFDLAGEVLARSRAVVVHSRFALGRLRLLHGAAAGHVVVIPHLMPPSPTPDRAAARARLGIAEGTVLVVTAGFATAAKRCDWLIDALELAIGRGAALHWIHAGEERAAEFPLASRIAERPALRGQTRITGYLEADALADHIAACDLLVNLRYPSSGESSGSLARGLAAGACCIVSDTAGYAELPVEAVVRIPLAGAVPALAAALRGLAAEPDRARAIGAAGRRHALAEMALPVVAERYRQVIEASRTRPVCVPDAGPALGRPRLVVVDADAQLLPATVAAALGPGGGARRLLLTVPDLAALADLSIVAPGLLAALLPAHARLDRLRVVEGPPRAGLLLDLHLGFPA